MASEYLFVYGSLRRGRAAPENAHLMKNCEFVDEAAAPGDLFDFGEFTGAVFAPDSKSLVRGEVFKLPADASGLRDLDEYEGYIPQTPDKSLFVREMVTAQTDDHRQINCWVYQVNRSMVKLHTGREVHTH